MTYKKKLEIERKKMVHLPRNQRGSVTSVANRTKENVLARTTSQAIVCMKTSLTLSVTGTTIITMETQVLDVLIIVTRYATIARIKATSKNFKWKADNTAGKGQENTVKQELAFVTCDSPVVEVFYED